jgi:hypothetical protein
LPSPGLPGPPGPAPAGLPGPRAFCSAWPAPGPAPAGRNGACPLSHARAAAVPGRRRLLRGRPGVPAGMPKLGRPGWAPQSASAISRDWRRPRPAGDSGGAPHELSQVQDLRDPRSSHSPPLPRRINPPEPAGVEANWRTYGGHVENPPPPEWGVSGGPAPWPSQLSWVIGAVGPGAPGRWRRRSQADAARTRPPSPPKLVRAARPLPQAGLAAISTLHGFSP